MRRSYRRRRSHEGHGIEYHVGEHDLLVPRLTDGFYQILMRPEDVPLTAVSTPSGML